jgi:hypothetical protein
MNPFHRARLAAMSAVVLVGFCFTPAPAASGDLSSWTLVQDPPHASFTASATTTAATLRAIGGPVPGATDIGFMSVNGQTPATSTAGYAFDPSASLALAIDFGLSFSSTPTGMLAIGFGIGEDGDGRNSAGVVLLTSNGAPLFPASFGAAARVNDINQPAQPLLLAGALSGTFFASYDAATGDVTLGASATPGASAPSASANYAGLQGAWDGHLLLASFFLRSESWQSGQAEATFANFRILQGAVTTIPEPALLPLLGLACLAILRPRRPAASAGWIS